MTANVRKGKTAFKLAMTPVCLRAAAFSPCMSETCENPALCLQKKMNINSATETEEEGKKKLQPGWKKISISL